MAQNGISKTILYDGVCNLCHGSVGFIAKHDHKQQFTFLPLQGDEAQKILSEHDAEIEDLSTVVLIEKGVIYTKSTAVLRSLKHLCRPWRWFSALIILPEGLRNFFYDFIGKRRYKWFGKKD